MRPCPQARWGRWTSGRCDDSPRFDGVWTWVLVSNIAGDLRKADEGAPEVIEIRANRVIKNVSPEDRRWQNSTHWSRFSRYRDWFAAEMCCREKPISMPAIWRESCLKGAAYEDATACFSYPGRGIGCGGGYFGRNQY